MYTPKCAHKVCSLVKVLKTEKPNMLFLIKKLLVCWQATQPNIQHDEEINFMYKIRLPKPSLSSASSLFSLPSSLTSSLLPLSHLYSFLLLLSWDLAPYLPSLSPSPSSLLLPSSLSLALMGPSALPSLSLFISTLSSPSFFLSLLLPWDLAPSLPSLSSSPLFLLPPSSSLSCSHGT